MSGKKFGLLHGSPFFGCYARERERERDKKHSSKSLEERKKVVD